MGDSCCGSCFGGARSLLASADSQCRSLRSCGTTRFQNELLTWIRFSIVYVPFQLFVLSIHLGRTVLGSYQPARILPVGIQATAGSLPTQIPTAGKHPTLSDARELLKSAICPQLWILLCHGSFRSIWSVPVQMPCSAPNPSTVLYRKFSSFQVWLHLCPIGLLVSCFRSYWAWCFYGTARMSSGLH